MITNRKIKKQIKLIQHWQNQADLNLIKIKDLHRKNLEFHKNNYIYEVNKAKQELKLYEGWNDKFPR